MKPVIGITSVFDPENKKHLLDNRYVESVEKCGGVPLILPISTEKTNVEKMISLLDGVIISGGADIDPVYYGEINEGKSVLADSRLDENSRIIADIIKSNDIPVLGICRGMQAINVFFGGTLIQDIPTETVCEEVHSKSGEAVFHNVAVKESSFIADLAETEKVRVNSYHHQSVKDVAPSFKVTAVSDFGIIEAMESTERKNIFCVQWHPERDWEECPLNKKIIESFIKICSK